MILSHTNSCFQIQHYSSKSIWQQCHNQLDGALPQYTARSNFQVRKVSLDIYNHLSNWRSFISPSNRKRLKCLTCLYIRVRNNKEKKSETIEETHVPAKAKWAPTSNIITSTANNKVYSIITAWRRTPFCLQKQPTSHRYYTVTYLAKTKLKKMRQKVWKEL